MESTDHLLAEAQRYGYVEAGGVWLRPVLAQPARQIGLVKETDEAALLYFAQRFETLTAKIDALLAKMDASENKGSFLMKALHLKEQLRTFDGLGDFEALHRRLTEAEEAIGVTVAQNREKNLATKQSFIQEAEALRDTVEWVSASEKVKDLRQGWLKTGPVDKHLTDELERRFQAAIQEFFDRRKAFQSDKKAMVARVQNRYRDLIQQAEDLKNSDQFETTSRQLKQLQQAWREVNGTLPKKQASELWTRFRAANNHFFERLKAHIAAQQAAGAGSAATPEVLLARKRTLAERAEALMAVPPQEAIHQAKALQAEWKQVGTVRGEESDRIWQRFMVACDKIFELSALEYHLRKRAATEPVPTAPAERARFRANTLRELLKDDHTELAALRDNLDKLSPSAANDAFRQMLQTKIRSFERKIRTKNDLIVLFTQQAQAAG
ncbi:DUF349 domain-containing protein [Hymenobacter properus]|uniref:DUF349 domain-containing protein n=1 Tax=Hymenobacter properus TaxID=2791026 RepID=A0A931BIF4_9BACT|nr:DUF349 domain-containing protein [Hymenobacter properus]MBF9142913.1 DUF349 domain-containing protein [Hymenobacter properus]MBR7721720.1 DUF349 domain-containing protein [Microvirga sp. SRT04]